MFFTRASLKARAEPATGIGSLDGSCAHVRAPRANAIADGGLPVPAASARAGC